MAKLIRTQLDDDVVDKLVVSVGFTMCGPLLALAGRLTDAAA